MALTWQVPSWEGVCVQVVGVLEPQKGLGCTSLILIIREELPLDCHVGDKAWERQGNTWSPLSWALDKLPAAGTAKTHLHTSLNWTHGTGCTVGIWFGFFWRKQRKNQKETPFFFAPLIQKGLRHTGADFWLAGAEPFQLPCSVLLTATGNVLNPYQRLILGLSESSAFL